MPKTDTVYMRIEPMLKANAEMVLSTLGLTPNEAITIFLKQVVLQRGLPFAVKIPPMTKAEAKEVFFEKVKEAEESFENEERLTLKELKEKLGV
ncbi:MAG: type II toxin-antitoxin system RelB/DinJ family antitoxin [Firmicutes bacterium]|nr:type II toxin-antitoxin system RelB/DinJ family antitoxin [Bacillota bacterium]